MSRIVCQFSCGAASAVATKLALAKFGATHDVQIINAFIAEEHPDNRRFLDDCQTWFGQSVTVLRDEKYRASAIKVFTDRRYMKGLQGATCSKHLKRAVLDAWKQPGDVMVFGFTIEEVERLAEFRAHNQDFEVIAPLIEAELSKSDCKAIIERAGIELPLMYRLGYSNANCIGCVKGGEGYMRAIRNDFPEQFEALAKIEEDIGPSAFLFRDRKSGERRSLRELSIGKIARDEELPTCSFYCEMAERAIA